MVIEQSRGISSTTNNWPYVLRERLGAVYDENVIQIKTKKRCVCVAGGGSMSELTWAAHHT